MKRPLILNAEQLRKESEQWKKQRAKFKKNMIYIILDNVLDTYNIGSIFRLADALAVKKVYLCAGTETPPNHRIRKAAINTDEWVEWVYFEDATKAIKEIREKEPDIQIIAIEQTARAVPYNTFEYKLPTALIVGHESEGVSEKALKAVDAVVELPMFGVNRSLNVVVSLGIVLYKVVESCLAG